MASSGTTCPCCGRAVSYTKARKLRVHVPYERKSNVDILERGRNCIGSGRTWDEAKQAADERAELRRAVFCPTDA